MMSDKDGCDGTVNFSVSLNVTNAPGPGCSKLTTSLVKISLNFQKLISQICQYFLLIKCEKLFSFFLQKISVFLVIKPAAKETPKLVTFKLIENKIC